MSETIWIVATKECQPETIERALLKKITDNVIVINSDDDARRHLLSSKSAVVDMLVWDIQAEHHNSVIRLMREIKAANPHLPILAIVPYGEHVIAESALEAGASDFLTKPLSPIRLQTSVRNIIHKQRLSQEIVRLAHVTNGHVGWGDIVCDSIAMKAPVTLAKAAAISDGPVWMHGEQGTGKELMARAIHTSSSRSGRSFVVFDGNHASMQDTNAMQQKVHEAAHGTIYIKSMASLSTPLQRVLLDSIAQSKARAIYSSQLQNGFADYVIALPPLRERKDDIPKLAKHFMRMHSASENKNILSLHADAVALLEKEEWVGNVRQLSHLLFRAVMLCNQDILDAGTLRLMQQWQPAHFTSQPANTPSIASPSGGVRPLKAIEEEAIVYALRDAGGCMTRAARNLGIGRSTLYRRVSDLGLTAYMPRPNQMTPPTMRVS